MLIVPCVENRSLVFALFGKLAAKCIRAITFSLWISWPDKKTAAVSLHFLSMNCHHENKIDETLVFVVLLRNLSAIRQLDTLYKIQHSVDLSTASNVQPLNNSIFALTCDSFRINDAGCDHELTSLWHVWVSHFTCCCHSAMLWSSACIDMGKIPLSTSLPLCSDNHQITELPHSC